MGKHAMRTVLVAVLLSLASGCSLRYAARTVYDAPTVPGAIASLVLSVLEEGSPPTYDIISDAIVDCVDDYEDSSPATSDLMIHFGDNLDCVCWHDWVKRISYERPGYEPNPMYQRSFCPVQDEPVAVTQAIEAPPPLTVTTTVDPPAVDPECASEYGADHFMCVDRSEWYK